MYQSFEDESDSAAVPGRLQAFREELAARKLDGFLVPHSDEHQNEFLPASSERLRFLTGFTGSAGVAIILAKAAVLFVDGRYSLQARAQIPDIFEVLRTPEAKASHWIKDNLPGGGAIGYDPKLHTVKEIERLTETLAKADIKLQPQPTNPIDLIWRDRPPSPAAAVVPHPLELAGRSAKEKLIEIGETLAKDKVDAALLTLPDSIAWLFNIRGADIAHTPVALAFALIPASGKASLFIDAPKIGDNVRGHLADVAEIVSPGELEGRLTALGKSGANIRLDPETASVHFKQVLEAAGAKIVSGEDPCILPKAIKSEAEIAGARAAHLRDGAAMARFLAWLDENAGGGNVDEISAAERLEEFRRETGKLKDLSFDTISAAGAHGAIVHYRPTRATNAKIEPGTLFLIDSGGQYADGTTDVTRTIAIGQPAAEMRRHYTLVLKAHIAIATARFPKGSRGQDLDPFARRPLWDAGLDYDHGTGHGVGSFLSVHEPPQRLSRHGSVELKPGMILSNEPGLYREGDYGIRLETLILVTDLQRIEGGDREMMAFETLTLVPFDRRLIDASLLSPEELRWLNAYHAEVGEKIGPLLGDKDRSWLAGATAPMN